MFSQRIIFIFDMFSLVSILLSSLVLLKNNSKGHSSIEDYGGRGACMESRGRMAKSISVMQ